MFETIRRTFASNNPSQRTKSKYDFYQKSSQKITSDRYLRSAQTITAADSNEETDSSLSDDFKSIQNSIISINRPSSLVLRRYQTSHHRTSLSLRSSFFVIDSFAPNPSSSLSTPSASGEETPWLHENITR